MEETQLPPLQIQYPPDKVYTWKLAKYSKASGAGIILGSLGNSIGSKVYLLKLIWARCILSTRQFFKCVLSFGGDCIGYNQEFVRQQHYIEGCPKICQNVHRFVLIKSIGLCGTMNAQNISGLLWHICVLLVLQRTIGLISAKIWTIGVFRDMLLYTLDIHIIYTWCSWTVDKIGMSPICIFGGASGTTSTVHWPMSSCILLRLTASSTGHSCNRCIFWSFMETMCVQWICIWVTLVWPILCCTRSDKDRQERIYLLLDAVSLTALYNKSLISIPSILYNQLNYMH